MRGPRAGAWCHRPNDPWARLGSRVLWLLDDRGRHRASLARARLMSAAASTPPGQSQTLRSLGAGRVFDGENAIGPAMVLIEHGRIVDVDTTGAAPPEGALV